MVLWYIFVRFGILYQEKSGNPGQLSMSALKFLSPAVRNLSIFFSTVSKQRVAGNLILGGCSDWEIMGKH
jgi:hypothetical protein